MKTYRDVVCIVDFSEAPNNSDVAAFATAARERSAKFITFEGGEEALAGVESGDVYAVMANNSYLQGYRAVLELSSLCRRTELGLPAPGQGGVNVPVSVVQQGSVAEFRAQMSSVKPRPAA
jgi:ABC-type sugar transport system substrate-binding protein